jgi:hypothetical protein
MTSGGRAEGGGFGGDGEVIACWIFGEVRGGDDSRVLFELWLRWRGRSGCAAG